jgi:glycosyltransferase involved in cell wall biosynthesis
MRKKLLYISPFLAYDNVPHAGGKSHNYYLKKLNEDPEFEVKLVTFCKKEEEKYIDFKKYNLDYKVTVLKNNNKLKELKNKVINSNPFDRNAGMCPKYLDRGIMNELIRLKSNQYYPDYIILEWTQTVLLADKIRSVFSNSKIIAIEQDITYQSFERKSRYGTSAIKKGVYKIKYKNMLKSEVSALKECDLVLTLNVKDYDILRNSNTDFNKLDYICPYYMDLSGVTPKFNSKNIMFFGGMYRKENYESCIWFIENVFYDLIKIDKSYKFYIVGHKPNEKIMKYASDNIIITGYVEDVKPFFEQAMCVVAPLVLGAGIKIKVLEGMSAGCVVITNDIGIEGIPAESGKHYFHCEKPEEYLKIITEICNNKVDVRKVSEKAKLHLKQNFSREAGYSKLKDLIKNL